jgi:hypothetical protein
MEELFNVDLVIIYGCINQKLKQSKKEIKAEITSPKSNNNLLANKKDDNVNEELSKTEETIQS